MEKRPNVVRKGRQQAAVAVDELTAPGRARVAAAAQGAFSSDLGPAAMALLADLGARPLAQVMGACIYTVGASGVPVLGEPGYRDYFSRRWSSGPVMFELRRLSDAYNRARGTALSRLRDQAVQAAADLVIGIDVRLTEHEANDTRMIEYVVAGTALRLDGAAGLAVPHLSVLSAPDYWCLWQAGYEPVGIAAATSIYYVRPSATTAQAQAKRWRARQPNQELPDFSLAATRARDACQSRMRQQAKQLSGAGIVDLSLELSHSIGAGLAPDEATRRNQRNGNLHLIVHGVGTIVRRRSEPGPTPADTTPRPVLWLR